MFHATCVGLTDVPEDDWFCQLCVDAGVVEVGAGVSARAAQRICDGPGGGGAAARPSKYRGVYQESELCARTGTRQWNARLEHAADRGRAVQVDSIEPRVESAYSFSACIWNLKNCCRRFGSISSCAATPRRQRTRRQEDAGDRYVTGHLRSRGRRCPRGRALQALPFPADPYCLLPSVPVYP